MITTWFHEFPIATAEISNQSEGIFFVQTKKIFVLIKVLFTYEYIVYDFCVL